MGPQGLYLNKWTPDFEPTQDVPFAVLIWVRIPDLPLNYWNFDSLEIIGNKIVNYIDRVKGKINFLVEEYV